MTVQVSVTGPDDSPKVHECFFIDLIPVEEFGIVAKIPEEPGELPKRALRAIKTPRERKSLM
jgi:hypothetical protein